jgi:hypothetical protein
VTPGGTIPFIESSSSVFPAAESAFSSSESFDGAFGTTRHKDELRHTRIQRLFNRILNQRLIDNREHFLRARFRCRQESGATPGNRKNRSPDHGPHWLSPSLPKETE